MYSQAIATAELLSLKKNYEAIRELATMITMLRKINKQAKTFRMQKQKIDRKTNKKRQRSKRERYKQ